MIKVDLLNNLEIARSIVMKLHGKKFTIVSCTLRDGKLIGRLTFLRDMELANTDPGGFTIKDGITRIPLVPSRSILWDLDEGEVQIAIEDGEVLIVRELPHKKTIYRVVLL